MSPAGIFYAANQCPETKPAEPSSELLYASGHFHFARPSALQPVPQWNQYPLNLKNPLLSVCL